jgi:hypothetical protein
MFRTVVALVSVVALSSLAGCASNAAPAVSPSETSLAEQVPAQRVAAQPPEEFEMELSAPRGSSERHFTRDRELAASLHPTLASHDE